MQQLAYPQPEPAQVWQWSRQQISDWQVQQFNRQLELILPNNKFYSRKLLDSGIDLDSRLESLEQLAQWPLTTKAELVESCQSSSIGFSRHQTHLRSQYSRLHRTSGTRGQPMMILDSAADWQWWSATWQHVLQAARITAEDNVFLAFSFGPFIGFWSAHQALVDRGAMVIPGGGLSTLARLEFIRQSGANVVCCTPTYALRMAEVASAEGFELSRLPVDRLIVAGEAGGSIAEVRGRIESLWQAQVIDHAGATEIGPWGFGWPDRIGMHVIESCFIAEIIPLAKHTAMAEPENNDWQRSSLQQFPSAPTLSENQPASEASSSVGELVLTSLGRYGAPVIRYRTGDVVCMADPVDQAGCCNFRWLPQGIMGRADDMVTIRGVNIFPSSIDKLVSKVPQIAEYHVQVSRAGNLDQLQLMVEGSPQACNELSQLLELNLGLRIPVQAVPSGSLSRSDAKSNRWLDMRNQQ